MARAARFSSRVDVGVLAACIMGSIVAIALPTSMREPIAESLRRSLVAPLVALERGAERWRMAWLDFEKQTTRIDSLAVRSFDEQALRQENDQLRKLLGLGGRLGWGFVPAEALHNTAREDVVTTLTLTAGSEAGIKTFLPVVAPDGIVGIVQTADPTLSIAILFSHPDFRASAMSADGSAFGIVYPHLGSGAERYLLELRNVPFRTALKPGQVILTSGLGGTFPRGIPIGVVVGELRTAEGWTRNYLVRPMVNPGSVSAVFVLSPQRVGQGVGGVWASVASVDSAVRRVASAGDSVARQAALADAAARRASLDSAAGITRPAARSDSTRRGASASRSDSGRGRDTTRLRERALVRRDTTRARRDTMAVRDTVRVRRDSARVRRDTTANDTGRGASRLRRP